MVSDYRITYCGVSDGMFVLVAVPINHIELGAPYRPVTEKLKHTYAITPTFQPKFSLDTDCLLVGFIRFFWDTCQTQSFALRSLGAVISIWRKTKWKHHFTVWTITMSHCQLSKLLRIANMQQVQNLYHSKIKVISKWISNLSSEWRVPYHSRVWVAEYWIKIQDILRHNEEYRHQRFKDLKLIHLNHTVSQPS